MNWLDEVDLYLQPALSGKSRPSLIEAMSRVVQPRARYTGGIPDLLQPECLHRPGDAGRLSELILKAVADPAWRTAQARRNFEVAKDYARDRLDDRRDAFLRRFARQVAKQEA